MPKAPRVHGPRPLKELGQNFLLDEEVASDIIKSMNLSWEERAVEIGPGRGVLLRFLLKKSHRVTAIEFDFRLQKSLEKTYGGHPGLDLIFQDFLQFDLVDFFRQSESPVKLVGNIPYNLSAPILFKLFTAAEHAQADSINPFLSAVLMLQKEVAQRLCANPGSRTYGAITVLRALVADAEMQFQVPSTAFMPPPKVTSAVVLLKFYKKPRYQINDPELFVDLVHHVFRQRRKMIKNSVCSLSWIQPEWRSVDFDFEKRPEELSVEQFIYLYNLIRQI